MDGCTSTVSIMQGLFEWTPAGCTGSLRSVVVCSDGRRAGAGLGGLGIETFARAKVQLAELNALRLQLEHASGVVERHLQHRVGGAVPWIFRGHRRRRDSDHANRACLSQHRARERMGLSGQFMDHSGLGGQSRITSEDMVKALVWANRTGAGLKPILRSYAMRDDKGAEIEGHAVKVVAKSGTLNFASGLAGYIMPPGGRELVFAVFSADVAQRAALAEADREDPPGGQAWTKRARRLQGQLVNRWAGAYA